MKLYDVPRNSFVKIKDESKTPPSSEQIETDEVLFFDHIDGMYSFCINKDGHIVHPAAWTEVEVLSEDDPAVAELKLILN